MIQALCCCLNESETNHDVHRVLNRVKRIVAMDKVSNTPSFPERHDKKQIPMVQDTLIREVFLKRGLSNVVDEDALSREVQTLSTTDQDAAQETVIKNRKKKGDKCKIM